ncbi:MAG TPA: EamA family transporter [Gemmatimonadaceae bacterium]|nr:EamA family transporter [Gemmatimonadaceae bacterium]
MTDTAVHAPSRARLIAGFTTVYVLWGSTYLAIRIGVETIPPFIMGAIRFLIAGSVLYLLVRPRERPTLAQWKSDAIVGVLLLVFGNGAVMWAEQKVPSGIASLLAAVVPLWMVLLDWGRRGGKRPTAMVIAGVVLGLVGLAVLVNPFGSASAGVDRVGALVLLGGSLSWAVGSLYSKHAPHHPKPLVAPAMQMLAGGAGLAILSVLSGDVTRLHPSAVSTDSMLAVLYLVIFGSLVGYSVYIWLLRVATASAVSTYAYVNPVVAVFLGWLILSEPLTPRTLVAAAIIVGAVALITRGSGRTEKDSDESASGEHRATLGDRAARRTVREKRAARTPKSAA